MFNDRDIGMIGAGAVLSIMCLLLPVTFAWKIGVGFFTLTASILVALLRIGGDGLTLEEWIYRRVRFHFRPSTWTFYQRKPEPRKKGLHSQEAPTSAVQQEPVREASRRTQALSWTLSARTGERLAGILLAVVGVYFIFWLQDGGAAQLGFDLGVLLP